MLLVLLDEAMARGVESRHVLLEPTKPPFVLLPTQLPGTIQVPQDAHRIHCGPSVLIPSCCLDTRRQEWSQSQQSHHCQENSYTYTAVHQKYQRSLSNYLMVCRTPVEFLCPVTQLWTGARSLQ